VQHGISRAAVRQSGRGAAGDHRSQLSFYDYRRSLRRGSRCQPSGLPISGQRRVPSRSCGVGAQPSAAACYRRPARERPDSEQPRRAYRCPGRRRFRARHGAASAGQLPRDGGHGGTGRRRRHASERARHRRGLQRGAGDADRRLAGVVAHPWHSPRYGLGVRHAQRRTSSSRPSRRSCGGAPPCPRPVRCPRGGRRHRTRPGRRRRSRSVAKRLRSRDS
jgi:hypothetical protein